MAAAILAPTWASKAVARVLAAAGAPTDQVSLAVDALLVRGGGRVILVDTGMGPDNHASLVASLKLAGVAAGEVTDVLITHAHFDHVGGLIDAAGHSAFPKAAIWFNAREWAAMLAVPGPHRITPAIAAQVRTFEPGREILPGITPIALYGHTAGHVGYIIASKGQQLEDIGDLAHSSIVELAEPGWRGGIDEDPTAGAADPRRRAETPRRRPHTDLRPRTSRSRGVGWVVPAGDGYIWKPDPEVRYSEPPRPGRIVRNTLSPSPARLRVARRNRQGIRRHARSHRPRRRGPLARAEEGAVRRHHRRRRQALQRADRRGHRHHHRGSARDSR